ncbi:hypothetical protein F5Y19DRAFT_479338 [Xylariaceae sp. FL1651]|nr:hypothetical protein F5Y19DRAFT_479338 [Xylariaceae sp. FL1651]
MTNSATESSKGGKRSGTRSVSTLTPSQLARKRANDREAQRAIRARTKEHIENLEREIDELRSQQSRDQTVQDLLQRNKALEDEVRRLRESLGIRTTGSSIPYTSSYHSSSSQPSSFGHSTPEYTMVSDMSPYSNVSVPTDVWPSTVPCSVPSTVSSPSSSGAPEDYGNNYYPTSVPSTILERHGIPSVVNSPTVSCIGGDMGFEDVKSAASRVWMRTTDQHRTNDPNIPPSAVEHISFVLPSVSGSNLARQPGLLYRETPVLNLSPSCQEDGLISGYIADCRRSIDLAGGQPQPEVILGPHRPNVRPLLHIQSHLLDSLGLHRFDTQMVPSHPLVNIAISIFDSNHLNLPLERIGGFLLFRALIAWLVQPNRDTYLGLRDIFPPQPSQQTVPHPQWMDFILWPHLRSAVIGRQDIYDTAEFRHIYSSSLQLRHWPADITEALTVDFSNGSIYATAEFVEHIWDLRNWGMHENFMRRYPELEYSLDYGRSV